MVGESGHLRWYTTLLITATKLVFLPLAGLGFFSLITTTGGLGVSEPPLWKMVCLIQHTVPSAVNIATLTTLLGFAEKEASTLLFWQYATCFLSMASYLILYMFLLF